MSATHTINKKSSSDNNVHRAKAIDDSSKLSKKQDDQLAKKSASENKLQPKPYLQTKLSVSTPGDSHEQEADRVADEVVSRSAANNSSPSETVSPGSSQPEKTLGNQQSLQTKISRLPDESVSKMESFEDTSETESAPSTTESQDDNQVSAEVEQQIESLKGNGSPLPDDVRSEMENQFSHDFSSVCIHNDAAADALCKQLSARAFAVGSDIFFASGEYAPDTQEGKRLLAHELTHVVQQGRGVTRQVMRERVANISEDTSNLGTYTFNSEGVNYQYKPDSSPKEIIISKIKIPRFKKDRHLQKYNSMKPFFVRRGPRDTDQTTNWRNYYSSNQIAKPPIFSAMQDASINPYFFRSDTNATFTLLGSKPELHPKFVIPFWDRNHTLRTFQVDHVVEDQLGGDASGNQRLEIDDATNLSNYELLERSANASSGSLIGGEINDKIQNAIDTFSDRDEIGRGNRRISERVRYIKEQYKVQFTDIDQTNTLNSHENSGVYWSVNEIQTGRQLDNFHLLTDQERNTFGSATAPLLFCSPTGGIPVAAPIGGGPYVPLWPRVVPKGDLQTFSGYAKVTVDAYSSRQNPGGSGVNARYPDIDIFFIPIPELGSSVYRIDKTRTVAGASRSAFQSLSLPGLSPIQIDDLDLDPVVGFIGQGKLLSSVPLFRDADIDILVQGAEIRLQKTFDIGEINVPAPFEVKNASITLFASSTNGLGIQGGICVAIDKIGQCNISAELSTASGLNISGTFNFDEGLFNGIDASVTASYRREDIFNEEDHGHWSVGGQIVIPRGKISGIETATVNMSYSDEEGFRAHGDATLSVPGVENGSIDITHNEEEGMIIAGEFNLRAGRGIRGGQISARVQEKPDGTGYAVSAHGEAQPDIPGINSNLIVDYNDGAFTAEVSADYERGMLSGRIHAGVTNRTVNEDGTLAETASEDNELVVFGDGELTIQIAPWLQGTAGVRFSPNGEITVIGRIGLPDELEIFARREINRSIFNIAVQAPIFPGIVAEIGGGLSATAGIGPGVIDQLTLQIEYNPAHEEDTHITGDAHLNIPANAGLRLNVRAGIGLGITGASATGGLDIGGTLGIEGAAEAGVHVDWTPATGLDITAELAVHAQPSFTFDIGGYVSVRALGFEVYDNRWQFASYTFGSDYRFGIRLPIHYHEGEPFDISTDDIEFEVPDIDTNQLLRGLIDRIA